LRKRKSSAALGAALPTDKEYQRAGLESWSEHTSDTHSHVTAAASNRQRPRSSLRSSPLQDSPPIGSAKKKNGAARLTRA
jgi:hypothetical protein